MQPVQLIAFDNNKNPYIPSNALALLKSLNTNNIHIIAVAGKYRTGKSYILNRVLLNKNQGFNVGHTINACTKGLWMWPELIKLNDKDCLIIDTEGLGSLEEGESTDLKIFLLALLFSSQLIYNSIGSIDQQAIQSLSLVIQLANVLQRQDKYDTQELVNTFPAFLWLIRDFSLKLQNQKGVPITPQQYLEHALKHQSRTSQAAQRKNQIRKQLRTFFQDRDCFALVRPTQQQRDLQNLSKVADSKLRPQFVSLVNGLKKKLSQSVKPKRVRGRVLTMDGFIQLCQYYTKALVDGKLPTISSHWDNLCLSQTHRIFQKYQLQHLTALQLLDGDISKMINTHKQIIKEGIQAINKSFLGKLEKQLFKQRFQRKLQNQLQQIKGRINNKKTLQIKLMLQSLADSQQKDPIQRYDSVILKMSQICENASKDQNLYGQFYLYLCQFSRNILQDCINKNFQQTQLTTIKIQLLQNQVLQLKTQIQENRKSQIQQTTQLRKKISEFQHLNSKEINLKQQKQFQQLIKLQYEIKNLNNQITQSSQKIAEKCNEIEYLKHSQQNKIQLIKSLQDKILAQQKQILQKDSLLNLQSIKYRKLIRQKQIIKQRYQQNLQQNVKLRQEIDQLQQNIKNIENLKYCKIQIDSQIHQLKKKLRLSQYQRKNNQRLIKDQKTTYQLLMNSPQNISYKALKYNFELQKQQKQRLEFKLNQLHLFLDKLSLITCSQCQLSFSPIHIKEHFSRCDQNMQILIDVSYSYNSHEELFFQISIKKRSSQSFIYKSLQEAINFLGYQLTKFTLKIQNDENCNQNEHIRLILENYLNENLHNPRVQAYLESKCAQIQSNYSLKLISMQIE